MPKQELEIFLAHTKKDNERMYIMGDKTEGYRQYRVTNRVELTDYAKCSQCEFARAKDK